MRLVSLVDGDKTMCRKIGIAMAASMLALSAASANVLYSTGFEAPAYTAGSTVVGVDGWAAGSGTGAFQQVTNAAAATGSQSLLFDNSTLVSFYSVRNTTGFSSLNATDPVSVSVMVNMTGNTGADRVYGLYLASSATGTMGGTMAGVTIDGSGRLRAGNTWGSTYSSTIWFAQADAGTYADRWLTLTISYDPVSRAATATVSGLAGAQPTYSSNFNLAATPVNAMNVQVGADYIGTAARTGMAYFDGLVVSQVPAPGSLALLGLGGLVAARRRR
jgi:hypothetical protein